MATLLGIKNKTTRGSQEVSATSVTGTRFQFSDTYVVQADNLTENQNDVMGASGVPALRSISSFAYLKRKEAKEVDAGALLWEVSCHYDSHIDADTPVVRISCQNEDTEEVIEFDQVTGQPIVNSVGERLIVVTPITIPVLVIERLEDSFNLATNLAYNNKVNQNPFWGAPQYCALMKGPTAEPQEIDGATKYRVTYRIKFNFKLDPETKVPAGWKAHLMNQGTRYSETTLNFLPTPSTFGPSIGIPIVTTSLKDFVTDDDKGSPTTGPLNYNGTRRTQESIDADGLSPILTLDYNRYGVADFDPLLLQ